jgi:O-antigen/teichoic acid export membrane protein
MVGMVVGNALATLYGLAVAGRHVGLRLSRPELRTMLAFGLPLVPTAAALWGLSFLDRVMLGQLADLSEVGQYAVGARFAMVVMFLVSAFGLAFSPFILSLWAEDRELEKRVRVRTLTYVTTVLTALSVLITLFAREIATVVAPGFDDAHRVVGLLCVGVVLFGISSVTMSGISFARRSRVFAICSAVAVAINAGLNVVLIPAIGGEGAALATAVAYGFLATAYYVVSQRLYPTPYEPRKAVLVVVLGAAVMPLGLLPLGLASVAAKVAGVAAFAGAVLALGVFDPPENAELRGILRRAARRAPAPAPNGVAGGV